MNIGELRHRVNLQSSSASQNDYGEQTESWTTYTTVWAAIKTLSGRELEHAQQISAEATHRVTARYNSSVTEENRVIFGSRTFEVVSINNPEERNEYLILLCKEVK